MTKNSYVPLRVLLLMIAVYHFVAGLAATFAQPMAVRLGSFLFGMRITLTPESVLLVRYLGVFGITLGALALFAALDPAGNRKIVYGLVVYCLVRVFDRIVFWETMQEFHVGPVPAWLRIIVILAMAAGLLFFSRTQQEQIS